MGLGTGVDLLSDGNDVLVRDPNTGLLSKLLTETNFAGRKPWAINPELPMVDFSDFQSMPPQGTWRQLVLPNPYPAQVHAPVHPSVLYFEEGWNGFKYWLAFTPYPGYDSQYENPCVLASDDLESFVEPAPNPLVPKPSSGYNADCHLFMGPDKTVMYMAFRERNSLNSLKVMHTRDGRTWSAPVTIASGTVAVTDFASPSIWWNGTGWTCISHQLDAGSPWPIRRMVSSSADIYGAWGAAANITFAPFTGRAWWHSFIIPLSNGRVVGVFQDNIGTSGSSGSLYLAESSDDGATFVLLGPVGTPGNKYRSAFALRKVDGDPILDLFLGDLAAIQVYHVAVKLGAKRAKACGFAAHFAAIQMPTNLAPGIIATDSCTRADNAATPGSMDSGLAYTASSGVWGILGNKVNCSTTGRVVLAAGIVNHRIASIFSDYASGGQQYLMARFVDSSNYWRLGVGAGTAAGYTNLTLQNVVAGAIGAVNKVVGNIKRGDLVALEAVGKLIRCYVNGICVHEDLCITSAAGTSVGLQANGSPNALFKNIVITDSSLVA